MLPLVTFVKRSRQKICHQRVSCNHPNSISSWDDITMDFIEGLLPCNGKHAVLVVIDYLSKYAYFLPLSHPYIVKMVTKKFLKGVVKLHGMPRSIISD